jgi:hypothetical protein
LVISRQPVGPTEVSAEGSSEADVDADVLPAAEGLPVTVGDV